MHKRQEIIAAIKKCAERLGRAPSQAEFRRASKISWYQVYKHFRGMRQAVRAAGLEPGPRGSALDVNALTLDWAAVVRKLGRLPSRAEYCEHGVHHAGTLHARIVWSQMAHKFVLLVKEFHLEREWADVVKIVVGKFPLLELAKPFTAKDAQPPHQAKTGLAGGSGGAKEDFAADWRRETQIGEEGSSRELTRIDPNEIREPQRGPVQLPSVAQGRLRSAEAGGLEYLPLIATDNTDRQHGGMRLGRVVAAALAIEILMAAASGQQSTVSIQPEESNWQLANSNWQKPFTAKDAEPPHQAKTGLAGGPGGAKEDFAADWRREPQIELRLPELPKSADFHPTKPTSGLPGSPELPKFESQNQEPQWALRDEEERREPIPLIATDNTDRQHGRLQNTEETDTLMDKHGALAGGQAPCGRPVVYGEPLGLAAMAHAPTNELGVLFLFGILAAGMGFRVERLQAAFPDCEAKREVAPGKWELVLVELELYSRNFKSHRHNPKGCHVIVCWKHNWPDCPEWLEVIELSKVVKGEIG
jgi:hypothetical protein